MSKKEESSLRDSHIPQDVFGSSFETETRMSCDDFTVGFTSELEVQATTQDDTNILGLNDNMGGLVELDGLLQTHTADLSWLDLDGASAPTDNHTVVAELEDLWRTAEDSGFTLESNLIELDSVRYQESLTKESTQKELNVDTYTSIVTKAMRRSAKGENLQTILEDMCREAGEDLQQYKSAAEMVAQEHGLVGNVFIRKSAFPNYESGQWTGFIKKHCKSAQYLLVDENDFGHTYIVDGRCAMTHKQAVTDINWNTVYQKYSTLLSNTGYKLASGEPKVVLKKAFLSGPEQVVVETVFPVQEDITKNVTTVQAQEEIANYVQPNVTETLSKDIESAKFSKLTAKVHNKIQSMVASGLLPHEEGQSLLASTEHPNDVLKTATFIATRVESGSYMGQTNSLESLVALRELSTLREQKRMAETQALIDQRVAQKERENSFDYKAEKLLQRYASKVQGEINRGITGNLLQQYIDRAVPSKIQSLVLEKVSGLEQALVETQSETATYNDIVYTQHTATKQASHVNPNHVKVANVWVRQMMTEGFAGNDLDSLIINKFSNEFLQVAETDIQQVRSTHEGASGFLYVDASVYASPTGVTGCEKGALKHRANNIPAVAGMDRCGSCVHKNVLADGTPRCALFNKTLLFDVDVPNDIKKENIKSANMTDFETTASLFSSQNAPMYNPNEFGLENDLLENISLEDIHNSTEKLSKILFDGWNI